jgi:transposase InsO family protein
MRKTVPMSVRLAMIVAAESPGVCVTRLCAELGISRNRFYELRKRYAKEGPAGLEPRSRRPLSSPGQIPAVLEQRICRLREELLIDNGAQAIFYRLQRDGIDPLPSVRTVHRVLVRNGLVAPQPRKRPRTCWRRFEYADPNGCWQIDATQWQLRNRATVWVMDVLDDHSRYLCAAIAVPGDTVEAAWRAFQHGVAECGPPCQVLSDNGACFTGRGDGPGRFHTNLAALGVRAITSSPYHPQTCGKLERLHCTLKTWLRTQPPARTLTELQTQLDAFRAYYNHHRPHRALHGATPAERFHARAKATPGQPIPLPGPGPQLLFADRTVCANGRLNAAGTSIGMGARWAGHTLTVIVYGTRIAVFDGTTLIRALTIDPTRSYQPRLSPMS